MAQLKTTTSIVDFLKTKGQPYTFSARKGLYRESGLETRLGGYLGSGQQNVALLSWAQKQAAPTPATTPTATARKELPFPSSQAQMGEYQKKYTFTGGKWYGEAAAPAAPTAPTAYKTVKTAAGYASVPISPAPAPATDVPVRIGGKLYPSQKWYDEHIGTGTPTAPPSPQVPESLVKRFEKIKAQAETLMGRVKEEGVVTEEGKVLIPPAVPKPLEEPETPEPEEEVPTPLTEIPEADVEPEEEEPEAGTTASPLEGKDVAETVELQDTDLTNIIQDISSGELADVDITVAEEAKKLAVEGEERRATQALNALQKQLARQGMTFSGIRTEAEQAVVAQSLANKAGISIKFASAIIAAAKQEQSRREQANKAGQQAQATALKAAGYTQIGGQLYPTVERERFEAAEEERAVEEAEKPRKEALEALKAMGYTLIDGKLYPTLAREKAEEEKLPTSAQEYEYAVESGYTGTYEEWKQGREEPMLRTVRGDLVAYYPRTGISIVIHRVPEADKNLGVKYFTDDKGNVTKVVVNPKTGEEISRESLGNLGRTGKMGWGFSDLLDIYSPMEETKE